MPQFRSAPLLAGLIAAAVVSACSKADASGGTASRAPGATAAVAPVAGVATSLTASTTDTLTDSLLIALADRGRLLGKESSPIWIVMISDFQCPYCKNFHDDAMTSLRRDYIETGKARMAYLNLPLQQHKHAMIEAQAALCAGVQGQFWPFSEGLFARQAAVATMSTIQPLVDSLARHLKLDMGAFASCQQRPAIRRLVDSDIQQATKAGVRSTPSFLVGDFLVEGAMPYADFRKAIDTALVVARSAKRSP